MYTSTIFTLPVTWCGLRPSFQPQLYAYKTSELRFRKPINIFITTEARSVE